MAMDNPYHRDPKEVPLSYPGGTKNGACKVAPDRDALGLERGRRRIRHFSARCARERAAGCGWRSLFRAGAAAPREGGKRAWLWAATAEIVQRDAGPAVRLLQVIPETTQGRRAEGPSSVSPYSCPWRAAGERQAGEAERRARRRAAALAVAALASACWRAQ